MTDNAPAYSTLTIGLTTSRDLYLKLQADSDRLVNAWHPFDCFNFFVTAWHLHHDWRASDHPKDPSRIKRHEQKLPAEILLLMNTVRDLANGSKHFKLDRPSEAKKVVEETHDGTVGDFYEYFFHEDLPGVTVNNSVYMSIRTLNNLVMAYFAWVFDDSIDAGSFPAELIESIRYCDVANREGTIAPDLWMKHINSAYGDSQTATSDSMENPIISTAPPVL